MVSADTYFEQDLSALGELPDGCLGRLLMTANPPHHPEGDFAIGNDGVLFHGGDRLTYTGSGLFSPDLVSGAPGPAFMLRAVFDPAVDRGLLRGVRSDSYWCDVGTTERLEGLLERLKTDVG